MNARTVLILAFTLLAGCGGGGSDGPPGAPTRFLYASAYGGPNTFPAAIYGFAVYADGTLSLLPGSPAATADGGGPIAITRDSKLLYTTSFGGLAGYQIGADGSLSDAPAAAFVLSDTPVGLVTHPAA